MLNKTPGETNRKQKTETVRENREKRALKAIVSQVRRIQVCISCFWWGVDAAPFHWPAFFFFDRAVQNVFVNVKNHYCYCTVSPNLVQLKHKKAAATLKHSTGTISDPSDKY